LPPAQIWYVVSQAPQGWAFSEGFVTEAIMRDRLFPASGSTLGLMCGPPGLLNFVVVPGLNAMGYAESTHVSF
jgi:NAD(P)H-flavin reductase